MARTRSTKLKLPRAPGPWMGSFEWALYQTIDRANEAWIAADTRHRTTMTAIIVELITLSREPNRAVNFLRGDDLQDRVARMVLEAMRGGDEAPR